MENKTEGKRPVLDWISYWKKRIDKGDHGSYAAYSIASSYGLLGRKKEALRWLKKSLDQCRFSYRTAVNDPSFDYMRNDPDFIQSLKEAKEKVDILRE